jgi:hypothetical protein
MNLTTLLIWAATSFPPAQEVIQPAEYISSAFTSATIGAGTETVVAEDGYFKLKFPGEPTRSSDIVETEAGDITMVTYMYEESSTRVYMLAYSDYPADLVEASNPADLVDGGRNGALESLGIETTETLETVTLKGHPGQEFTGNNGQYFVRYRIYLVNNRLYQLACLSDGAYSDEKTFAKFVKSFKVSK